MKSRNKKAVNLEQLDEIVPFQQKDLVKNTTSFDGACLAFCTMFFKERNLFSANANRNVLLQRSINEQDQIIQHIKDGEPEETYAYRSQGKSTDIILTTPAKIAEVLEDKQDAIVTFPTTSGERHAVAFAQRSKNCAVFDPNRFYAEGKGNICAEVLQTLVQKDAASVDSIVSITTPQKK